MPTESAAVSRLEERVSALQREVQVAIAVLTRAARASEVRNLRALKLAASELSRRLHVLNGETERMKELHAVMVTAEKFDAKIGDLLRRIELLEGTGREHVGRSLGSARTRQGFHTGWLIVSGAVGLAFGAIATGLALYAAFRPHGP